VTYGHRAIASPACCRTDHRRTRYSKTVWLVRWSGLDGTGRFLATIGFPSGRRSALIAGLGEVCGGVFLAFGLLTPAAAALLLSVMLVAAVTVHIKNGFFVQNGGYEYTFVLGIAALTVAFAGPGSLSLDALLGHRLSGAFWGIAALFVGACGAAISLIQRRAVLPKETVDCATFL
jgi:putative oxidoreductase